MKLFWLLIYNLSLRLYIASIHFSAIFIIKARKWVTGRKGWKHKLLNANPEKKSLIWMHCASLGEYEQGKPVWEALRQAHKSSFFLLTFFSPSGFEAKKTDPLADLVLYLPADTKANARYFIEWANPDLVLMVKYELWYHYISELTERKIKTVLIAAVFRPKQWFFYFPGKFFMEKLRQLSHIFVQDEASLKLLHSHRVHNVSVAYDTRFDRVVEIASEKWNISAIDEFCHDAFLIVAGSTWLEDEKLLAKNLLILPEKAKLILAPHEVNIRHLTQIKSLFKHAILFSKWDSKKRDDASILIIDRMGILSKLYRYADLAYIGGGFGRSVHNVLEAAVYGIPLIFGPKHKKSLEALELLELNAALTVNNQRSFKAALRKYSNEDERMNAGRKANQYIMNHIGGTEQITRFLLSDS